MLMMVVVAWNIQSVRCLKKIGIHQEAKDVKKELIPLPRNVEAVFPSEPCGDSVEVTWRFPDKNELVESYIVKCESLTDRQVEIVDAQTNTAVIGPLENDMEYVCSVASKGVLYASDFVTSDPFETTK